ncbi:hypothetical protein MHU86_10009 [Fragilaria crotonensis]|nr:hypothetical protein MHU86_10009 [Fragilaria crotonensis]
MLSEAACRVRQQVMPHRKNSFINWIDPPEAEHPVLEILLEKWFMSPFGSSMAMREGTLNEANVLPLGLFLQTHSENECPLQYYKEYGLLCGKDAFFPAFSPDAIAVLLIPDVGQVTALVEIKSKCSTATGSAERDVFSATVWIREAC